MAHRRRRLYEDQGARTSILAGATAPRPDTLTQTGQINSHMPLADGAGHTFQSNRRQADQRENANNQPGRRIIGDPHHDDRADDHEEPDRHHPIAATP
jgi:hypothetical protein